MNILAAFSNIFSYLRANQVLVVGWRTWDGSLALWDRMGDLSRDKCGDEQGAEDSGCFQALGQEVQGLEPGS